MKVGAADVDQHKELGGRFGIQGFPTIKIFAGNKNKPEDYRGPRFVRCTIISSTGFFEILTYQKRENSAFF